MELDQTSLKELLHYDPERGEFRWKVAISNRVHVGDVAGCLSHGYQQIAIRGKSYTGARLAWLYVYGQWPFNELDFKNGIKSDIRIDNLREASYSENSCNRGKTRVNTSGYKGVSRSRTPGKWKAQISVNSEHHHLGTFDTKEAAYAAYIAFGREHHGEFFHP